MRVRATIYDEVRPLVVAAAGGQAAGVELMVRLVGALESLPCVGVGIVDSSLEYSEQPHVEVLGIPDSEYGQLFPQHVAAYEALFPAGGA